MSNSAYEVQKIYLAYFGRPADPVGLYVWESSDASTMQAGFAASAEYAALYSGLTTEQRVNQVYQNLLGRPAETAGLAYWVNELNAGRVNIGTLALAVLNGAQGSDAQTVQNRISYCTSFTASLDTLQEIQGYSGNLAAANARIAVSAVMSTSASLTTALNNLTIATNAIFQGISPATAIAAAAGDGGAAAAAAAQFTMTESGHLVTITGSSTDAVAITLNGGATTRAGNAVTPSSGTLVGDTGVDSSGYSGAVTVTLAAAANTFIGSAAVDTVVVPISSFTGSAHFADGANVLDVTNTGATNISTATIDKTGSLALKFDGGGAAQNITMTNAEYGVFSSMTTGAGDAAANNTITFSDAGTVTANANVGNYNLSTAGNAITLNSAVDNVTGAASGDDTVDLAALAYTGTVAFGAAGSDTIKVSGSSNISGGTITTTGATVALVLSGAGTTTVSSAEAALFHAATSAIVAPGSNTMNIADATSLISLNAKENALTTVGLQAGSNSVTISVGAASVNAGAAGFNHTVSENGTGSNTFRIDNGSAVIVGASDATHYVTINNFNTVSDNIMLTLSNNAQNNGEQNISDSGNDTVTVGVNSVIVEEDLGALPGFTIFNATDLASAQANMLRAINASASTSGAYTFVIDSNNGAAIYEMHINSGGGTIDGIQLVGVVHGVGAFNLVGHIS